MSPKHIPQGWANTPRVSGMGARGETGTLKPRCSQDGLWEGSPRFLWGWLGIGERDNLVGHSVGIPLVPLAPYRSLLPRAAQVPKGAQGTSWPLPIRPSMYDEHPRSSGESRG